MNHAQFRVPFGNVTVKWGENGTLSQVELNTTTDGVPLWNLLSRTPLPSNVAHAIDSLKAYLEKGGPIAPLSWDSIDSSEFSDFQKRVYDAITHIPYGETRTYSWVAMRTHKNGITPAARAVGQALKKNPLPILIPCHRVVAASNIGGFMGKSGQADPELKMKQWLLDLEASYVNPIFPFLVKEPEFLLQYA
ncbi:MGMT family protein [bacterium]|jgi:methylated-DNA-[protein]-cysteine S-methyltransferase|nr:MGMT family protein [bacterium]